MTQLGGIIILIMEQIADVPVGTKWSFFVPSRS